MLTAGALFGQVMTQGPFIGSATPSEAKVFVRTDQPANVTLRYGSDPNLDAYLESAAFATGSPNDLAEIISLSGLTPGSSYYFNVLVRRPTANRATLFFFYNCWSMRIGCCTGNTRTVWHYIHRRGIKMERFRATRRWETSRSFGPSCRRIQKRSRRSGRCQPRPGCSRIPRTIHGIPSRPAAYPHEHTEPCSSIAGYGHAGG